METSIEKLEIIAELKKRIDEFLSQEPKHEFIDLMEVFEEPEFP